LVIVGGIRPEKGQLRASIKVGDRKHELFFDSHLEFSDNLAEALLLLALPAAMRCGGPLVIEAPVSQQLLNQVPAIQAYYSSWVPKLNPVDVRAPHREVGSQAPRSLKPRKANAFTAGVDSFYSAIRTPGAALVFIHGLDIPLGNLDLRKSVSEKLAWAASELDRPLLEMETNLRSFSDRYLNWNQAYGGALAACALLLSRYLDVFSIPAGQSQDTVQPGGSHPDLTPLFGTENIAIQTTGFKATRVNKVKAIAAHPVVQGALRVCWENRGNTYNCGVCEKCLRTMAALEIFGELGNYSTFTVPLDYARLARAVARTPALERFIQENLLAARTKNASPELIESLEKSLDPSRVWLLRFLHYRIPRVFYDGCYRVFQRKQMD
jgi:hypothetical protein